MNTDKSNQQPLANVTIILVRPRYPENIGAAARVAFNMGIQQLITVDPENQDREKMLKMATHKAAHLIDNMEVHPDLETALAPFSWVVGTTARLGNKRRVELTPRAAAAQIVPLLQGNRVALMFGNETMGLDNNALKYCQMITTIPTADFSSLNLAQAVAILTYELFQAASGRRETIHTPRLATTYELEGMFGHLEEFLKRIQVLKTEDTRYWMTSIRNLLGRRELRARETKIIRGFCQQFLHHFSEQGKK